ncbi:MAG: site-specific integrase [Thermoleophilia bacterium]
MPVYKRGSTWYYDIVVGGKRLRRATNATDKRGAEVEAVLAKRKQLTAPDDTGITLKAAIMRVYKEEWQHNKSGLRMVNRTLKIVDILGNIPLETVDEAQIAKMVDFFEKKKLTQSSINRYRAYLRRVLNLAQKKWRVLDRIPYIRNTREIPKQFKVYTDAEEKLILSMSNREFADLASLLFDTGMRLGEALRLKNSEVDFGSNTIVVWADATKGGKSRGIPMTRRVSQMLQRRTLPFAFKDGHEVERIWKRFRKKEGIEGEGWTIHAIRHTFASRLVRRGIGLYSVKELLGHSTITVTERYAHLDPAKLQAAVAVLEQSDVV